ncbi:hypothetical protein [Kutzneria sp. NPDC052558]|uniref:hypothetical protein n=1 Tax=Kutzneria sp. NPDC052558 TaxID=3364121 RepID=UPI0037C6DD16
MLRKLLVVVPALALVAVTAGAAAAAPVSRSPAPAPRAACTADTPEVKAIVASMNSFMTALTATPPDTAKMQGIAGDMINELVALQKAGCLELPAPARIQDPQACLNDLQGMGAALFGLLAAVLKTPPDPAGITTATTAIGAAITKFNTDNCLPIKLPVPGGGGLPAPPGGVPAPPGGLPAPPTIPGT